MYRTTVAGIVVGLAVGSVGCGGPPVGPAGHAAKERHALVVLMDDGSGGCLAKAPDRHNAYKYDVVIWEVQSYCGAAKSVEIRFTRTNPLDTSSLTSKPEGSGHRWKDIKGKVSGDPGTYPYELWVNGARAGDPEIEVDPF